MAERCATQVQDPGPIRCERPAGHDGYHTAYLAIEDKTAAWLAPDDPGYEHLSNFADLKAWAARIGYGIDRDPEDAT